MPIESAISSSRSRSSQPAAAGLDPLEHRQRPGGSFAAGRALAAALVGEEPATVVEEVDRSSRSRRARSLPPCPAPGSRPCTGPLKSSGVSSSSAVNRPGAQAAGDDRLGLAAFPHAAAESLDHVAAGEPQRAFVAARPVHVPADAVELRPEAARVAGIVGVGRDADRAEPGRRRGRGCASRRPRLDVVDHRRLAEQPFDGRERAA